MILLRIALVAGRRVGKTSTLLGLAEALRRASIPFTGVAQPASGPGEPVTAYVLEDLVTGERHGLAHRAPGASGFRFDDRGWPWAAGRILRPTSVLLVDELGLREAAGGGHLPAVARALAAPALRAAVLAVRRECLPALEAQLGPMDPVVLDGLSRGPEVVSALLSRIKEVLT